MPARTWASLFLALVLLLLFVVTGRRVLEPLVPLRLFKLRNYAMVNVLGFLWSAGNVGWFFFSALYLQHVLGYDPYPVGLALEVLLALWWINQYFSNLLQIRERAKADLMLLCHSREVEGDQITEDQPTLDLNGTVGFCESFDSSTSSVQQIDAH
jgi:hypothetical protein